MKSTSYDVTIVGAGPNGLTAAVVLGTAGLSVMVLERNATVGGSCRTEALTLPGFAHDVCGAIHPMGAASPIFRALELSRHGVDWRTAPLALAHPFVDQPPAVLSRNMTVTTESLGTDGLAWEQMVKPFVERHEAFFFDILKPIRLPRHPLLMARFASLGLWSCDHLAGRFTQARTRALFAGNAAHSCLALDAVASASFGVVLAVAGHSVDWPCARGGSARIIEALTSLAQIVGCEIVTDTTVASLDEIPESSAVLLDVTPRQLERIAGDRLSAEYRRMLARYRYGPGAFKVDYALSDPIPWRASEVGSAATVHVGGTYEEIAASEATVASGRAPDAPFVLVAQQSHFDSSRAPAGQHTGWAYCHVPNGCTIDMTDRIEAQIERFAPGFRDTLLARHAMSPAALESHNPNLVGGDIGGGANGIDQFLFRPGLRWHPYATSDPRVFLCSSATPPGGGVHGMCGYWAARSVLRRVFHRPVPQALAL